MSCPRCGFAVPSGHPVCPHCRLPLATPALPPAPPPALYRRVRPLAGRATTATIFIAGVAVLGMLDAFVPLVGVWAAREVSSSGGSGRATAFTLVQDVSTLALLAGSLVAGVWFLVWLYRARSNLGAFYDAYPRLSTGLVIGAWLLPVANLILPGMVVADTARESVPPAEPRRRRRLVALVWSWWTVYLLGVVAGIA